METEAIREEVAEAVFEGEHGVNFGFEEGAGGESERNVVIAAESADLFDDIGGDVDIGAPNWGGDAQRGVFGGFLRGVRWDDGLI